MADESVVLEAIIRASAQNMGAFAEAKAAAAAVGNGVTVTATQTRGLTVATNEAKVAERDLAAEANAAARAFGSLGAQGAEATSRFTTLGTLMGSGGMLSVGIGAAIVGFAALAVGIKASIDNADNLQGALNNLDLAYQTQGQALQTNGAWIDDFLKKNARFIDDQYSARDAIAQVVRAGYDQSSTMRLAADAVDVAAAKHESFAQAVNDLQMGIQGNTRTLATFGLTAAEVKEATKGVTNENERAAIVLALVEAHALGAAGGLSDMNQSTDHLNKAWQDFSASLGGTVTGPIAQGLESFAQFLTLINDNADAIGRLINLLKDLINTAGPLGWALTGTLPIGGQPGGMPTGQVGQAFNAPQGNHITVNVNGAGDPTTTGLVTAQTLHSLMNA